MNIREWPEGRIMQLPDSYFGQRWPILFHKLLPVQIVTYLISMEALPDICVLWELHIWTWCQNTTVQRNMGEVNLVWADAIPTTDTQFRALQPLFPGAKNFMQIAGGIGGCIHLNRLKMVQKPQGRRIAIRFETEAVGYQEIQVALVFSSFPTEVPDCLLSG